MLGGVFSATKCYLCLGLHRNRDSFHRFCSLAVLQHAAHSLDFEAEKLECLSYCVNSLALERALDKDRRK